MSTEPTFLRPSFTAKIAGYLRNGYKVNVYSAEKKGLRQLVEDLRQSCPDHTKFISLNMRSHAHSVDSYLTALCDALGLRTQNQPDMRTALLDYLDQHPDHSIHLCLPRFILG
jgi:hypothetical protein